MGDGIAPAVIRHFLATILILCELCMLARRLHIGSSSEPMGVWQEDLTMITFLLALVVYLGVTVLLLAFVAVLSRANEDRAQTFVRVEEGAKTFVRFGERPMSAMF